MIIYPAIDLSGGECVRLYRGDFGSKTVYSHQPLETARAFERGGAEWIHVVDLDGAREGSASQTETIFEIARGTGLSLQVGGGIREASQVETLLNGGIDRVVVGSRAVEAAAETRGWLAEFGPERIVLAFDVRLKDGVPVPAIRGWQTDSNASLWDVLGEYQGSGLRHVLCTDIDRDGTLVGPNTDLYRELRWRFLGMEVLASGGVSGLDDLRALQRVRADGVVVGKALYEERFTLSEALEC